MTIAAGMPTSSAAYDGSERVTSADAAPSIKPIVVASDASPAADAAFTMARLLAHRCGLPVEIVTVVEPSATHVAMSSALAAPVADDLARMEILRGRVRRQLDLVVGDRTGWPVDTRYGEPAPMIHRKARERDAELLIMGMNRHGMMDRLAGEDTTAHVTQLTGTPLLAIASDVDRLPRRVVIALSADTPEIPSSAALRTLLSEVETVDFVHVRADDIEFPFATPASPSALSNDLEAARRLIMSSLECPMRAYREPVVLSGNPAKKVLEFASAVSADLIILGRRHTWVLRRWLGGGMATRLLGNADCSLLIVPRCRQARYPTAHSAAAMAGGGRTEMLRDHALWAPRLAKLSRSNSGRPVTLEIDDASFGARTQVSRAPFLGVDFDRGDDRITVMIGAPLGGASHLTHSVSAPVSLEILEGIYGKTLALRVATRHGQALLTFLT